MRIVIEQHRHMSIRNSLLNKAANSPIHTVNTNLTNDECRITQNRVELDMDTQSLNVVKKEGEIAKILIIISCPVCFLNTSNQNTTMT